MLNKLFPFSDVTKETKSLARSIIVYLAVGVIIGIILSVASFVLGIIPILGAVIKWILGIISSFVGLYIILGLALSVYNYLK